MLTPTRFRDSDDALMRELLASAQQDCAPSLSRERVAQGLGLGSSTSNGVAGNAALVPPGAASVPSRLLRLQLGALPKYLLVGLATGLAAAGGWRLTAPARSVAPAQVLEAPSSAASADDPATLLPPSAALEPAASEPAVAPSTPVTPSTPAAPQPAAARPPAPRRPAPASPPVPRSASVPVQALPQSDTLLAEVAQLDRARAALRDQHPAQAIGELDAYAATFPSAKLALEADVLRVHALLAARGPSAAAALAERLLDRPGSEQYRAELRRVIAATREQRSPR